jgi:drug/metabolite transporter (DMT)-like permease
VSKQSEKQIEDLSEKVVTPRFILAIVLVLVGIAWIVYYYVAVRVDPTKIPAPKPGDPAFMADLKNWNYAIGLGLAMLGLVIASNKKTPLGRGRGVVVGMLGCFGIGLLWIVLFYVFSNNNAQDIPVLNDLQNYNLLVGIAFMAVGFAYATKWE